MEIVVEIFNKKNGFIRNKVNGNITQLKIQGRPYLTY